jgi:hypothetical protein
MAVFELSFGSGPAASPTGRPDLSAKIYRPASRQCKPGRWRHARTKRMKKMADLNLAMFENSQIHFVKRRKGTGFP